jgi:hypothetical protein
MQSIAALDQKRIATERSQALSEAARSLVDRLLSSSNQLVRNTRLRKPLPGFRWSSLSEDGTIKFVVVANSNVSNSSPTEVRVFDHDESKAA